MQMLSLDRLIAVTRFAERLPFAVEILNAKETTSEFLSIVLCKKENSDEWITWSFNHSCGGFYHGHYFPDSKAKAVKDFILR